MKTISLKQVTIIGTIFMIVSGSMLHFIYQLSGSNQIVALFSAVNESVWEHGKLFLLPLIIVLSFEYLKIKNLEKILWIALSQLVIMLSFTIVFFYTYTGAFGIENLFIDILTFVVAVIIGQTLAYKQLVSKKKPPLNKYASSIILIAILLAFAVITYFPPNLPIFTPHSMMD